MEWLSSTILSLVEFTQEFYTGADWCGGSHICTWFGLSFFYILVTRFLHYYDYEINSIMYLYSLSTLFEKVFPWIDHLYLLTAYFFYLKGTAQFYYVFYIIVHSICCNNCYLKKCLWCSLSSQTEGSRALKYGRFLPRGKNSLYSYLQKTRFPQTMEFLRHFNDIACRE